MEHKRASSSGIVRLTHFSVSKKELLPILSILTAVFLWGGSFSAMRVAVRDLHPCSVMWIRMTIALLLLAPFARKLKPKVYIKGDWKLLTLMALFLPCLYSFLESYALRFTTSSQAGVISASVPLIVALGAWLTLSEPIHPKTIIGLTMAAAGVIFLTFLADPRGAAVIPYVGNVLECFAMVSAAAGMIIIKRLCGRYNPWTLTAAQILAGSVFFIPGLFFLFRTGTTPWTSQLIANLIFLGSFVTMGAFGLFNWGISRISAVRAAAFINLVPVTAVFFGWILLDETLNFEQSLSGLAVIGGVWLSQKSGVHEKSKKP